MLCITWQLQHDILCFRSHGNQTQCSTNQPRINSERFDSLWWFLNGSQTHSIDIGPFNSNKPLFRLNYVYSINNWHFDDAPVSELNDVCSKRPHLQHISFPQLENNRIQVLLWIDATQYILEKEFLQGPKNTPFAIRNLLGWTRTSPMRNNKEPTSFLSAMTHSTEKRRSQQMKKILWQIIQPASGR